MKRMLLLSFALSLFFTAKAFSVDFTCYINKAEGDAYEVILVPDVYFSWGTYVKGPAMANYEQATFSQEFYTETWHSSSMTFSELQTFIQGTWYIKIVLYSSQSVYSFTISDILEVSDFLPNPSIIEPEQGEDNMISPDCYATWDPNGADINADKLWLWAGWYYDWPSISQTSCDLGWLNIGENYCKIGYCKSAPSGLMGPLQYVSGTSITWDSSLAWLLSSDRHTFTVTSSLDLNNDWFIDFKDFALLCLDEYDTIDLEDYAAFCRHWLEYGPTE